MTYLDIDSPVSMNMWGLPKEFFDILEEGFQKFLEDTPQDDLKAEYLLPTLIGQLLQEEDRCESPEIKRAVVWGDL